MPDSTIDTQLEIHQHTYWNPINYFLLSEDTYPHWNIFCIEDGLFEYQVTDQSGVGRFGDLICCPPHLPLRRKAITSLKFHFFRFSFHNEVNYEHLPVGKIKIRDLKRLSSTYAHLRTMAYNESPNMNQWKAHLLYDIWAIYWMENQQDTPYHNREKINDPIIYEAVDYLQEHGYSKIHMSDLSTSLGLSPVQFTRRFQASIGVTPLEYLTSLRLRKVRTLLLETDYTLEYIANLSGFNNGFYLSRVFSRKMKMSPSLFRRTHQI